MTDRVVVLRRSFLLGLGLAVSGLSLGGSTSAAPAPTKKPESEKAPAAKPEPKPDLFVQIATDGSVRITCHRSEMGQGIRSTLPALIAAELGADMARVTIVQANGDKAYGDQNTDGSHSIRGQYDTLRRLGATARTMLIRVAAERWKVAPSSCIARNNAVFHEASHRSLPFGELAEAASALPLPKKEDVVFRPTSELPNGKLLPLVDAPNIVTGKAVFGADVKVPGMLTAMIARPPVLGGHAIRFDATKARAIAGVRRVVELPRPKPPFGFQPLGGIAVIADHTWAAMKGRAALEIEWEAGENGFYNSVAYKETLTKSLDGPTAKSFRKKGDANAALAVAVKRVDAEYHTPHLAHAPMEPLVALARFAEGVCEVWTPTQNPQAARTEVAKALGIDESKVTIHVTLLGGGFGRKSKPDYVVEAALLAKEMGAPVRVQWSREDDVRHDYYHSTSAQRLSAGLDADNRLTAWHHRMAFPPIGSMFTGMSFAGDGDLQQGVLDLPLSADAVLCENFEAKAMTRIGWLRSVANIYHAFAVQSFIDEIAAARGVDPLDNLKHVLGPERKATLEELGIPKLSNYGQSLDEHPIDTARHYRVLDRVAEVSGWRSRKSTGRALGIAVHRSFLTYVAAVVSVVRDGAGAIRVDEAWIVCDAGTVVNVDRARFQMEGAVVFALGHALLGSITMKDGATVEGNFHDYRLMRIGQAPRAIHAELIDSDGPPGGVGEPGVPPVAPALANAIFALTGSRVRELPVAKSMRVA